MARLAPGWAVSRARWCGSVGNGGGNSDADGADREVLYQPAAG
jgi:hypothetical protein